MKEFQVKGNTAEQKLKHMETVVTRLARRAHKTVGVAIPPIPISLYIPDAGSVRGIGGGIISYLSPIGGEIKKIFAKILWAGFGSGSLHVEVDRNKDITGSLFSLSKNSNSFDSSISLNEGDEVVISLHDMRGKRIEDPIPQFAMIVSFLFVPIVSKESIKETAIDALEEKVNEVVSD